MDEIIAVRAIKLCGGFLVYPLNCLKEFSKKVNNLTAVKNLVHLWKKIKIKML